MNNNSISEGEKLSVSQIKARLEQRIRQEHEEKNKDSTHRNKKPENEPKSPKKGTNTELTEPLMESIPIAEADNLLTTETKGTSTEMTEHSTQSTPIAEVENPLKTAQRVISNSSEIIQELSRKIKNIKKLLSIFKDRLSLGLGEDGFDYKILYLDQLTKFIKELGTPFVCQINNSEFFKALELCYLEHFELKKRIDEIIALVSNAIGFDKDDLGMEEYFKFVKRINPSFKLIAREPADDFENIVHEALRILRLCKDTDKALMKPPSKELNREEQISGAIKAIETLKKSRNRFKPECRPIELEFIDDIILQINQFEGNFFRLFKKVQKNIEKTPLPRKNSQKSHVPKQFEQELHKRTYFMDNEILIPDEGECIEYKDYSYPFNEMIEKTLQKTICSFLNQKGGRLYMGVDDKEKKVGGLTLTSKDRDSLKLNIYQMLDGFYPIITHEDFVKVECLPVYNKTKKAIPGRVVVKIIVKPGHRDQLYSVTKSALKCFIRKDGYCKNLEAEQILSVLKKKWSQTNDEKTDLKEFDDPKPEKLAEIKYESAAKKLTKQSQAINQTKNSKEEEKKQEIPPSKKLAHRSGSNDQVVKIKSEKKTLDEMLNRLGINPLLINPLITNPPILNRPVINPTNIMPENNNRVTYPFKLSGIPSDTTKEEIVSLFQGVVLASTSLKLDCPKPHAFIDFYDLEIGNNEAKKINSGEKKLRENTLKMVDNRVTYGFKLSGLPPDTTEEEIVFLVQGAVLASTSLKLDGPKPHAFINFYDLETGNNEAKKINSGEKKLRENTLKMVNQRVTHGFILTGLPTDTTEEEIVSLFTGVNLASTSLKLDGPKPFAFINFHDLKTGNNEAKKIDGGEKKLRDNTLRMVAQKKQ